MKRRQRQRKTGLLAACHLSKRCLFGAVPEQTYRRQCGLAVCEKSGENAMRGNDLGGYLRKTVSLAKAH
jgi:hypothetical protein